MPLERFHQALAAELDALRERGTLKGAETVIAKVIPAAGGNGPRYLLEGRGRPALPQDELEQLPGHVAAPRGDRGRGGTRPRPYGAGPGAVRFISGTYRHARRARGASSPPSTAARRR